MLNRKTVRVGDIFQILTSEGFCYGQITHTHPKYKFVIAVFRKFFSSLPENFEEVISAGPQIVTTFLAQDAVKQGLFSLVTNMAVPDHLSKFPTFRGTNNLKGDDTMWWFWDGEKEWKVHRPLTVEEKSFPAGPSLPSAPLLIERIEKNYSVEKDYV